MSYNTAIFTLLVTIFVDLCHADMGTVPYNATVFSDDPTPGSTVFSGYLDKETDTFYWKFNFTKPGVTELQSLEIRDGKPGVDILGIELQNFTTPFTGTDSFSGNFSSGINPAVAADATELAGHMCMGHIYAVVNTANGSQSAAINYNPKAAGAMDCYAAVGLQDHGMGDMPMEMHTGVDTSTSSAPMPLNSAGTRSTGAAVMSAVAVVVAALF